MSGTEVTLSGFRTQTGGDGTGSGYTAVTPMAFNAGDALGMQWGSSEPGNYLIIQAYLVVTLGA